MGLWGKHLGQAGDPRKKSCSTDGGLTLTVGGIKDHYTVIGGWSQDTTCSERSNSWFLGPLLARNPLRWKSDQVMTGLKNNSVACCCPYSKIQIFYCSWQGLEWCYSLFTLPVSSLLFLQPCPLPLLPVTQFLKHIKLFPASKPVQT